MAKKRRAVKKQQTGPVRVKFPPKYGWKDARYGNVFYVSDDGILYLVPSEEFAAQRGYVPGVPRPSAMNPTIVEMDKTLSRWETFAAATEAVKEYDAKHRP